MGLPARSASVVTAAQLLPSALAAGLGGALLGAVLPRLLGPALDLTAFTDGYRPPTRVDLRTTPLLGAATLAVVLVAALLDAARSRGRRVGGVLRLGGTDDQG
jgi:putative ABC transport system permease protein